jgi:hypothetical protein
MLFAHKMNVEILKADHVVHWTAYTNHEMFLLICFCHKNRYLKLIIRLGYCSNARYIELACILVLMKRYFMVKRYILLSPSHEN